MSLTGQGPQLKFAEAITSLLHRDNVRFMQLPEEDSRLQILRQAGVVYQFRHAAPQGRLAAPPSMENHDKAG
jgi:hypothetical protein